MMGNNVGNIGQRLWSALNDKVEFCIWTGERWNHAAIQEVSFCVGDVSAPNIYKNFKITDCSFLINLTVVTPFPRSMF